MSQRLRQWEKSMDVMMKIINLAEKRKERERARIVARINEYYRQLRQQGWIICAPEVEE